MKWKWTRLRHGYYHSGDFRVFKDDGFWYCGYSNDATSNKYTNIFDFWPEVKFKTLHEAKAACVNTIAVYMGGLLDIVIASGKQ